MREYLSLMLNSEVDETSISHFLINSTEIEEENALKFSKELLSEIQKTEENETLLKLSSPIQMEEGESSIKEDFGMFYENEDKEDLDYYVVEEDEVCSFDKFLNDTRDTDPIKRAKALRRICPCKIKKNVEEFWDRIIEMHTDESPEVRFAVLHNMLDGSPACMELRVIETVEKLQCNDTDKRIKKICNKVLTVYRKTGKWNIL